ncbi:hypothetical protein ACIPL1_27410 [Pseudomonas sp. NPDC090202]|uniref:hypothetical protein n=1 Tax=Pseudomonas sp. NPDC090202 TaxID=3364476 RepID=UPI003802ADA2
MADSADPIIISPTLTYAGQAAAFNEDSNGLELKLTHVTFGTGHYDPTGNELGLLHPVGNPVPIAGGSRPTPTQIRMVVSWNENVGAVAIGEIGWWADDVLVYVWSKDDGTIASYKTDGAAYVLFNDLALAQVPAGSINIVVSPDESAALAALGAHEGDPDAHPQYVLSGEMPDAQKYLWCNVGGVVNALELQSHADTVVDTYVVGQVFRFKCALANTDAMTVRVNGMPSMAITKSGSQPLTSGDLVKGAIYDIIFDGINFQIAGGVGGAGSGAFFTTFEATSSAGQVTFPATYAPGSEMVFVGGYKLAKDAYTATDGANVTLKAAPAVGTKVIVLGFSRFAVADTLTKAEVAAIQAALQSKIATVADGGVSLDGPDVVYAGTTNTYTITDYDKFSVLTVTADVGTVSRSGATITLVVPSGTTAKQINMSIRRGNAELPRAIVIGVGASGVSQPTITSPANNATGTSLTPTIIASAFAPYPAGADTQAIAEWQFATDAAFTNVVYSYSGASNLTQITVPADKLASNTKYYVRVRYKGTTLAAYSDWSATVNFTTTAQYVVTPSIVSPVNNATGIKESPLVTCSAFTTYPANINAHVSTSWRIRLNGVVVYELLRSTSNLLSLTVPKGILQVSKTYTLEVAQHGGTMDSAFSAPCTFTTLAKFEYGVYVAAVGTAAPFVRLFGGDVDALKPLTDIDIQPANVNYCISFSPNGKYLAMTTNQSPYMSLYKRDGDALRKLPNPAVMPTGYCTRIVWTPDSKKVSFVGNSYTNTIGCFYSISDADEFTVISGNTPTREGVGAFSPDGAFFIGCSQSSNNPVLYSYINGVFTDLGLSYPTSWPIGGGIFSPDGMYLVLWTAAVSSQNAREILIYKKSGSTYVKILENGDSSYVIYDCAFSQDGKWFASCDYSAPYIHVYSIVNDVFTQQTVPAPAGAGIAFTVDFSYDSKYMYLSSGAILSVYKYNGTSWVLIDSSIQGNRATTTYPRPLGK